MRATTGADELLALLILPPKDPSPSSGPVSRHQRHDPQQPVTSPTAEWSSIPGVAPYEDTGGDVPAARTVTKTVDPPARPRASPR
jgi:hypothetical protein